MRLDDGAIIPVEIIEQTIALSDSIFSNVTMPVFSVYYGLRVIIPIINVPFS
jgi:hypothetical protein